MVWTVNDPECMMEAVRWEVDAILTDVTKTWLDLRAALEGASDCRFILNLLTSSAVDYDKVDQQYGRIFLWKNMFYYTPVQSLLRMAGRAYLERIAGPYEPVPVAAA